MRLESEAGSDPDEQNAGVMGDTDTADPFEQLATTSEVREAWEASKIASRIEATELAAGTHS